MTEADPQRWLELARSGIGPSEADRVRVGAALERRLDALAGTPGTGGGDGGGGSTSMAPPPASGWLAVTGTVGSVMAAVGVATFLWLGDAPTPPDARAPTAEQTVAPQEAVSGREAHAPIAAREAEAVNAPHAATPDIAEPAPDEAATAPALEPEPEAAMQPSQASHEAATPRGARVATSANDDRSRPSAPPAGRAARSKARAATVRTDDTVVLRADDAKAADITPAPVAPVAPSAEPEPLAAAAPTDFLAAELTLIDNASRALNAKRPAVAMDYLSRHRELYGQGTLGVEREALTALALCDLGKATAARARATAFLEQHPGSPLIDRVRRAAECEAR